jgi:hypothetical protein
MRFLPCLCILAISPMLPAAFAGEVRAGDDPSDDIGSYPLDGIERTLKPGALLPCAGPGLVTYRGEGMRYSSPARIDPAFRERLRVLDQLVVQTATEYYGRAPLRLQHLGTMNCRRMRMFGDWLSEHALGNAIDVAGFDFGPLPRGASLPEGAPKSFGPAWPGHKNHLHLYCAPYRVVAVF